MERELQASSSLGEGDLCFMARAVSNALRQGLPYPLTIGHPSLPLTAHPEPCHLCSGPSRGK